MKKFIFLTTSVVILGACGTSGHLTKRHKSIDYITDDSRIEQMIGVGGYTLNFEREAKDPKTIFDLSPKAQAALITEIGKKDTTSNQLITDSGKPLTVKNTTPEKVVDYTRITRKMVLSVSQLLPDQGDRIQKITIDVKFDNAIKIVGCSKLATEYETIDYGKLTYSTSQSAEVNGSLSAEAGSENTSEGKSVTAKTSAGITGNAKSSRSFTEEVALKERIASFVSIDNNSLSVSQQGAEGRTLEGNIIADVTFDLETTKVEKVYSFTNSLNDNLTIKPEKVKVAEKLLLLPDLTSDIQATICFKADYRHIINNAKTKSESDDIVEMISGKSSCQQTILVLRKKDLQPKIWKLCFSTDTAKIPIQIQNPSNSTGDLLFDSYEEAQQFIYWLKTSFNDSIKTISIGPRKYTITIPDGESVMDITILPYNF